MKDRFCKMVATLLTTGVLLTGCIENIEYKEDYSAETVQTDTDIDTTEDAGVDTTEESARPSDPSVQDPAQVYAQAISFLDRGDLQAAYGLFLTIRDYRNVEEYLSRFAFRSRVCLVYDDDSIFLEIFEYDSFGRVITEECLYDDGWRLKTQYYYNAYGQLVEQINPDGSIYTYEYDERGNNVRQRSSNGEEFILEYDENNNLVKETHKNGGQEDYSWVDLYTYDDQGRYVRHEFISSTTSFSFSETFRYDDKGNLLMIEYINGVYRSKTFAYDENGNCIREEWQYSDGGTHFYDYEYDSAGNLVVEQSPSERCTYTYDAQGNKTQMIVYENNGEIFKTDYRYDSYGNLLMVEQHYGDNTVRIYSKYQLYYDPYVQNDFRQLLK